MANANDTEMTELAAAALERAEQEVARGYALVAREFLGYYRSSVKRGGAQPTDGARRAEKVQSEIDRARREARA